MMKASRNIHPSVVIYEGVELPQNVTVQANTVLGAEGIQATKNKQGEITLVPHASKLIIEEDVEIGPNTTVQKGVLKPTIIGKGTKIGPNCNIGHQAQIGAHCIITGNNHIGGSAHIGDHTYVAPHSTIKNSVKIGSNVFVGIGSLVMHDVEDGQTVVGRPAEEITQFRRRRTYLKEISRDGEICVVCREEKKSGVTLHDTWICVDCCVACSIIVKCGNLEEKG